MPPAPPPSLLSVERCGTSPTMAAGGTDRDERERLAAALKRVAAKDEAALGEVYHRTHAKLFGICLRILRDREEAEDALQEIYLKVWRNAASFDRTRASPITWLATLARNGAVDSLRASTRPRPSAPIEQASGIADPREDAFTAAAGDQEGARLARCIDELDPHQASAIKSAFLDGATYNQLAQRSSVPLGTMKSWVRRGLLRLRDCLGR